MSIHNGCRIAAVLCVMGYAAGFSPAWAVQGEAGGETDLIKLRAAYECDKLATRPLDVSSPAKGVAFDAIDAEPAIRACREATRRFPTTGRFYTQLGRALLKVKRLGQAGRALKKAENLSHPPALNIIGYMYENGLSVVRNARKAREYYKRAAKPGDAFGQYNMGRVFLKGIGGVKSNLQGMEYLRKAADKGMVDAMFMLGSVERTRRGGNVARAMEWFEMAAKAGHVASQNLLGHAYLTGSGVAKNPELAFKWTEKAAASGNEDAQERLAYLYMDGIGTRTSLAAAADWLKKAGEQGNVVAQAKLGGMYLYGEGVEKNHFEAMKWLRKAYMSGEPLAVFHLGVMYEKGIGVKQNSSYARQYFKEAAEAGNREAQLKLDAAAKHASLSNREVYEAFRKDDDISGKEASGKKVVALPQVSGMPAAKPAKKISVKFSSLGLIGRLD